MIALGTNWGYIAGGYGAALVVVLALIFWAVFDSRRQKRRIADLEAARVKARGA